MSKTDMMVAINEASVLAALVFRTMGWTWSPDGGEKYVPNAEQIADTYHRLLVDMQETKGWAHSTGRLLVQRDELHGYSFLIRLGDYSTDEDEYQA